MDDLAELLINLFDTFEKDFLPGFNRFVKKRFYNFKLHFFSRAVQHHENLCRKMQDKIDNLNNTIAIVSTVPNYDKEKLANMQEEKKLYELEKAKNEEILRKVNSVKYHD
jgi:uncharacterized protein (UPF0276 family)